MLQKLKVTSYAFIYFLMFGFSLGIPSPGFTQTDHTSTYTPNIAVGPHIWRAMSTGINAWMGLVNPHDGFISDARATQQEG